MRKLILLSLIAAAALSPVHPAYASRASREARLAREAAAAKAAQESAKLAQEAAIAAAGFDTRTVALESDLEGRVRKNLEVLLADQSRVVVNARVTVGPATEKKPDDALGAEATDAGDDLAYIPSGPGADHGSLAGPVDVVRSIELDVRVSDQLAPNVLEEVKRIATWAVPPTRGKVTVMGDPSLDLVAARARAREEAARSPASEPEKPFAKYLPFATPVAATIVVLGIIFLGLFLRGAGNALAGSVGRLADTTSAAISSAGRKPRGDGPAVEPEKKKEEVVPPPVAPPVPTTARQLQKGLQAVGDLLENDTMLLLRALKATGQGVRGCRWLLGRLDRTRGARLVGLFGKGFSEKIMSTTLDESFDGQAWLQRLVETAALTPFAPLSPIEKALEPADYASLLGAKEDTLVAAARDANRREVWAVVLDFVSQAEVSMRLRGGSDASVWSEVIAGTEITAPEEIAEGVKALKAALPAFEETEAVAGKPGLQEPLVEAIVELVEQQPLGREQSFLEEIVGHNPSAMETLQAAVWTLKDLLALSDAQLAGSFRALSQAERVSFLASLPEESRNRFAMMLPAGFGRTVLVDECQRLLKRNDPEERRASLEIARRFIAEIRAVNPKTPVDAAA